jgi:hypothetical protein
MVYALHKFRHFLLGNKFVFYVPYGSSVLGQQTICVRKEARWLLLFLEYEFIVVYKPGKTHVIVDVLSKLLNSSKLLGIPNQIVDASLFFVKHIWMQEVKTYLKMGKMLKTLNIIQKQKLARKAKPFILKKGIIYKVGQDNKMHICLTTSKAQNFLKELH